jgi:ankyrin repeat protein
MIDDYMNKIVVMVVGFFSCFTSCVVFSVDDDALAVVQQKLISAVSANNMQQVELVLASHVHDSVSILNRLSNSSTALSVAIQNNYFDLAQYLIDRGASLYPELSNQTTLFNSAIESPNPQAAVEFLLNKGLDINLASSEKGTVLSAACAKGPSFYSLVNYLLDHGADCNLPVGHWREYPIHFAAKHENNSATVKALLDHGAIIDGIGSNFNTPLLLACKIKNNFEVISMLVSGGASVNLIKQPESISSQNEYMGYTPLMFAAKIPNNTKVLRLLIQNGAAIDAIDKTLKTALLYASGVKDNAANIKYLLGAKADTRHLDIHGRNVSDYLFKSGQSLEVLLEDSSSFADESPALVIDPVDQPSPHVSAAIPSSKSVVAEPVQSLSSPSSSVSKSNSNVTTITSAAFCSIIAGIIVKAILYFSLKSLLAERSKLKALGQSTEHLNALIAQRQAGNLGTIVGASLAGAGIGALIGYGRS